MNVYIVFYYIIINEIPGELSHVIFTGEKIIVAMGDIVNRALRSKKCLSEMFWYFIGVLYIRTLLGPSEIRNSLITRREISHLQKGSSNVFSLMF